MFIDTHCHITFKDYAEDRDEVINRAQEAGVSKLIEVGTFVEESRASVELARRYDFIYAGVGIHPHYADGVDERVMEEIKKLARSEKVAAIGEVGLDYYRGISPKEAQKGLFRKFLQMAKELNLPVIIHSREASEDTLDIIRDEVSVKGVMHCFSYGEEVLKTVLNLGLYISFTANITFPKAESLREVVRAAPLEKILLETDAPFLAPQIYRGKRNEPAYVRYVAEEIARVKGLSVEEVADRTSKNAEDLFGI